MPGRVDAMKLLLRREGEVRSRTKVFEAVAHVSRVLWVCAGY